MKPLLQGQLDGLCGVYSAINATRLIGKLTLEESQRLFLKACRLLESRKRLSNFLGQGLNSKDLSFLFRELIERRYPLRRFKPFPQAEAVALGSYWREIQGFLGERENRAVILVLGSWDWDHWTVIRKATGKTLYLFDSDTLKLLKRKDCTVSERSRSRSIVLYPSLTYFLEKKP